jgi:glycosyltransferase involved in cell wall biosynthesis
VVVSNEMGFRTFIALSYGTLFRKPVWVWWGGTLHTERNTTFVRRLMRALISRWARHWISYGQTSTEYLRLLGIPRNRIVEIQNSVDERLFGIPAARALNLEPRPVVLCVGQFIGRKGIDLLLDAASSLQGEGLMFSLLLVGSGPDRQRIEHGANALALKNVHFVSAQVPERMPAIYNSANVLVFPTLEDVWGLVANEAMLCRLPVLCSKYAGCATELFPSGNIFDPCNPDEFKAKLREAIQGRIAQSDCSRLRTTPQLVSELACALEGSLEPQVRSVPAAARTESYERQR